MPRPIARVEDVGFETSDATHPSDTGGTGAWKLVTSDVTQGDITLGPDAHVALGATAMWRYEGGTTSSGPLAPIQDQAVLEPGPTQLEDQGRHVLVDGDQAAGQSDPANRIVVATTQALLFTD